jgi:hypothetical protein
VWGNDRAAWKGSESPAEEDGQERIEILKRPKLAVMAAGMGSRYGGLKQIDPVTREGEIIIDFSLYDAMLAGFSDVVFIIKKEIEEEVRALIDERAGKHLNIEYAFQEKEDLPAGFSVPDGRVKPWGTAHALLAAKDLLDGPFAVINADDYYGQSAYRIIYDKLEANERKGEDRKFTMVGYILENTITENGSVARGVCEIDKDGCLFEINERTRIEKRNGGIEYSEDCGDSWTRLDPKSIVSMNLWGLTPVFLEAAERDFPAFLKKALSGPNALKAEYLLPIKVDEMLKSGEAEVEVLHTDEVWYGVTYRKDKQKVAEAFQALKDKGLYPEKLW